MLLIAFNFIHVHEPHKLTDFRATAFRTEPVKQTKKAKYAEHARQGSLYQLGSMGQQIHLVKIDLGMQSLIWCNDVSHEEIAVRRCWESLLSLSTSQRPLLLKQCQISSGLLPGNYCHRLLLPRARRAVQKCATNAPLFFCNPMMHGDRRCLRP